jgi:hypothetical protein
VLIALYAKSSRQRGDIQLETALIAMLVLIVKAENFRPVHLQRLGYPKRAIMRTLKRLISIDTIGKKRDGRYVVSSRVLLKVREVSLGIEELDGLGHFLLQMCYGEKYTVSQVEECIRRLSELKETLITEQS